MANEFAHQDTAGVTTLAKTDWLDTDIHQFDSQAEGDIMIATSATQLSRLGIGSTNEILTVIGGVPVWHDEIALGDDKFITLGTVKIGIETEDADAHTLIFAMPDGTATDVPVAIFGDQSILGVALGFDGITEPAIAVVNAAGDAYIRIDAGDDSVAAAKGIYFKVAADEDIELINLSVTGTPRVYWDESADCIRSTVGLISDGKCFIGDDANTFMTLGLTIKQASGTDDETFTLKQGGITHGLVSYTETDTFGYFKILANNAGGMKFGGFMENVANYPVLSFLSLGGQAMTTHSTAGKGLIEFYAAQNAGGDALADITADGIAYSWRLRRDSADISVMLLDEDGDLWLNATGKGITLASGTSGGADSAAVADEVSIGAYEFAAGNRGLAISAEAVVTVSGDIASTHTIPVRYNGVTYNVLCSNV